MIALNDSKRLRAHELAAVDEERRRAVRAQRPCRSSESSSTSALILGSSQSFLKLAPCRGPRPWRTSRCRRASSAVLFSNILSCSTQALSGSGARPPGTPSRRPWRARGRAAAGSSRRARRPCRTSSSSPLTRRLDALAERALEVAELDDRDLRGLLARGAGRARTARSSSAPRAAPARDGALAPAVGFCLSSMAARISGRPLPCFAMSMASLAIVGAARAVRVLLEAAGELAHAAAALAVALVERLQRRDLLRLGETGEAHGRHGRRGRTPSSSRPGTRSGSCRPCRAAWCRPGTAALSAATFSSDPPESACPPPAVFCPTM